MTQTGFAYEDDPAHPGWKRWQFRDPTRFNSFFDPVLVRVDDGIARVRITPRHEHSNMRGNMHGGALLAFIDITLFAAARALGVVQAGGAVTLDLATQFIGGAQIDVPLDAKIEMLRETKRLVFVRGLVTQADEPVIASFTATLRKSTPPPGLA